jgi:hypothetical protein
MDPSQSMTKQPTSDRITQAAPEDAYTTSSPTTQPVESPATKSWLYRGIAISSQFWRNHLSPMNLCPTRGTSKDSQEPGVVHRHIGWVDALILLLLLCTMISYFSLAPILRSVAKPLEIRMDEVRNLSEIANLFEKTDDTFLKAVASQIPFHLRLHNLPDELTPSDKTSVEYLAAINRILRSPSVLPSESGMREKTETSLLQSLKNSFLSNQDTPFLRLAVQRARFQSRLAANIKELPESKLQNYLDIVQRFRTYLVLITIYAIYRWLDIAILAITNSPIGLSSVAPGKRTDEQNKRLILLSFFHLIELTFCTAIILFCSEQAGWMRFKETFFANDTIEYAPAHALQTAFSTLSTVGYGTYAPNCAYSCLVCLASVITAVLLLSFVATSAYSVIHTTNHSPHFAQILNNKSRLKYCACFSILIFFLSTILYLVVQHTIPWYLFR